MATGYHYPHDEGPLAEAANPKMTMFRLTLAAAAISWRIARPGTRSSRYSCFSPPRSIYGATQIATDTSIDRLIAAGDPVELATRDFELVFPESEQALIMLEAPDPLSRAALQGAAELERRLDKIPNVQAHSLLTLHIFDRLHPPVSGLPMPSIFKLSPQGRRCFGAPG